MGQTIVNPKSQLNIVMNNVEIEQVQELLGVTLECKLLWSKHVDTTVAKMGRSLSIRKLRCLLNNTINKAGPTGPGFVAPGLLFSRVVRCPQSGAQNRAAQLALG